MSQGNGKNETKEKTDMENEILIVPRDNERVTDEILNKIETVQEEHNDKSSIMKEIELIPSEVPIKNSSSLVNLGGSQMINPISTKNPNHTNNQLGLGSSSSSKTNIGLANKSDGDNIIQQNLNLTEYQVRLNATSGKRLDLGKERKDPRKMTREELDEYLGSANRVSKNISPIQSTSLIEKNTLVASTKSPYGNLSEVKTSTSEKNLNTIFSRDITTLGLNFNYMNKSSNVLSTPIRPLVVPHQDLSTNYNIKRENDNQEPRDFKPYSSEYTADDFKPYVSNLRPYQAVDFRPLEVRTSSYNNYEPLQDNLSINSNEFSSDIGHSHGGHYALSHSHIYGLGSNIHRKPHTIVNNSEIIDSKNANACAKSIIHLQEQLLSLSRENEDLKMHQIALNNNKENDINNLRDQIEKFITDINCFKEEIRFHVEEKENFQRKMVELARDNDELTIRNNEDKLYLQRQIEDLKRKATTLEIDNRELVGEIEELKLKKKHDFETSNKQLDDMKKKLFDIERANDTLRKEKHEVEYYLSQTDENKEKIYNTIKNLTQEKEDYQRKFLSESQRADEMQSKLETQIRILDGEKMELSRNINELNRQLAIYETSINMLEDEKGRLFDFNSSEKETFKRKLDEQVVENEKNKNKMFHLNKEIMKLQQENKKAQDYKESLEDEIETLKKDISEGKRYLGTKIEEYDDKIQIMLNKFNKEKQELLSKIKALQNKVRFVEIEKLDEIRKYESLVTNLSDRLYKYEGKKYCYTKSFTNTMKINDRAKSMGSSDSVNRMVTKTMYKKQFTGSAAEDDFMDEVQKTYEETKGQIEVDKYLKRNNSAKKERPVKESAERDKQTVIKKNDSLRNLASDLKKSKIKEDSIRSANAEVEAMEKNIVEMNKDYNNMVAKLNIASNPSEISSLKKKIDKKHDELEKASEKLKKLKREKGV